MSQRCIPVTSRRLQALIRAVFSSASFHVPPMGVPTYLAATPRAHADFL